MADSLDPAIERRRLRGALRQLRRDRKLTQMKVAEDLDWSQPKLARIEQGRVRVSPTDLRALLEYYGQNDDATVHRYIEMAKRARKPAYDPMAAYRDVLSEEFQNYVRNERVASIIRQFDPILIPGLLQTPDYAYAILRAINPRDPEEKIQRRVAARLARQTILEDEADREMFFVVDESALRRPVGAESDTPEIMQQQLAHLKVLNKRDDIVIRVVPLRAGAYAGMRGPFYILEFPEDENLIYVEGFKEHIQRDDEDITNDYLEDFWKFEEMSVPSGDLDDFLDRISSE